MSDSHDDLLKKPVHLVLVKDTLLDKLRREGRLNAEHEYASAPPERPSLPVPQKQPSSLISRVMTQSTAKSGNIAKQSVLRSRLKVVYDNVPPIPPEKKPPCDSCKTAACCRAFVVAIEKEEYDTGLYGEHAIHLTPEMRKQLRADSFLMPIAVNVPTMFDGSTADGYFLEGVVGQPCPFLGKDNRCGIYAHRPLTCRMYTCVGDDRITQDMRDGKVDIGEAMKGIGPKSLKDE